MTTNPSSLERFRDECARIPDELEQASTLLSLDLSALVAGLKDGQGADVTGVGASEGPARHLAAVLIELGVPASYRPLSAFLAPRATRDRVLIVFSQGLSPNARLALTRAHEYGASLLVTDPGRSEDAVRELWTRVGVTVCELRVAREPRALVRFTGPILFRARAIALGLAIGEKLGRARPSWGEALVELPKSYRAAQEHGRALSRGELLGGEVQAIVLAEPIFDLAQIEASKWREAFWRSPPSIFDALGFAHGPLQALQQGGDPVLLVRGEAQSSKRLAERVQMCLARAGQRTVSADLSLPPPLSTFELDGIMNEIILDRMPDHPENWPGRQWDEPLYSLDTPDACSDNEESPGRATA